MNDIQIVWDLENDPTGNYWHIVVAGHGITREEVDEVIRDHHAEATTSRSSGQPIVFGWTSTGQYIAVFEHVLDDPLTVYPITAYPTQPPRRKKAKRK
jgi:hypothetical protein